MLPTLIATASLVALGACDNADATLPETEAVPTEFQLSAEDLQLSAEELEMLCGDTTDVVEGEEEPPIQVPGVIGGDRRQWSPGYPNEPGGFSRWAEHDFTELPNGALSHAGFASTSYGGSYGIVDDETASNGKALRIRFGSGLSDGVTPGRFFVFDKSSSRSATPLREWYVSLWVMLEPNSEGGWEAPPNEQKLWYGTGAGGPANKSGTVTLNYGGGANSVTTAFRTKFTARPCRDCVTKPYQDNRVSEQVIKVGRWHHLEFYGSLSTPGRSDATFRMWVDGNLVNEQTSVQNQDSDDWTMPFREFAWAPVWGGKCSGGCPKRLDDHMRLAHLYISGIPK